MILRPGGPRVREAFWRAAAPTCAAFAFAASLLGGAAFAHADVHAEKPPSHRLRVLTFNAFGIPRLSPAIDERMAAMAPAIDRLGVDVVLMQEIWRARDARTITEELRSAGFVAFRSFASDDWLDRGRSGLYVASKLPIVAESFEPFDAGELPHIPWHVDWRGGKGFLVVRVAAPLGDIAMLVSHTQASYATGEYEALRIAQITQIAASLRGPGSAAQVARPGDPLVIAGDLNAPPGSPSIRLLEHLTGARVASPGLDVDLVLARGGASLEARLVETRPVLEQPIPLREGGVVTLSDHPGVLAEYDLQPCRGPCGEAPQDDADGAVAAALAEVDGDLRRTTWLRAATAVGATLSAWLAVRIARLVGQPQRRRRERAVAAAFSVWCLFWAAWWTYTAVVFAPAHLAALDRARALVVAAAAEPHRRHVPVTVEAGSPR